MKNIKYFILISFMLVAQACDDMLEFEPGDEIIATEALQTPADLQELLNSSYDVLRGTDGNFFGGRTQAIAEVMGDNIDGKPSALNNADLLSYFNKTTSFFTGYTQAYFKEPHFVIYRANTLLDNLEMEGLTQSEADRIEGEAKFLRALCNFDLIRLFAQPYGFTASNSHLGIALRISPESTPRNRNTVAEVYAQIEQDLVDAASKLPSDNGIYANQWAAKSLLAKVYFHMHDFPKAFEQANDVLENGIFAFNPSANEFTNRYSVGGSDEAIFGMISFATDHRGSRFTTNFRTDSDNAPTLRISRDMYDVARQDPSDLRGQNWYIIENEGLENELISLTKFDGKNFFDVPLLTVTEVKFIRAEAAAELDNEAVALADLNDIRQRAGMETITGPIAKSLLLQRIRVDKRKEFVGEGLRFHDLRRIGAKGEDISIRGADWDCPGMAIQFPDGEIAGAGGAGFFTPNDEGGC